MTKKDPNTYHYRWLLLLICASIYFITWGVCYSVGIFYVRWVEYFQSSRAEIGFVCGLPAAAGCLLGPLLGTILHRIGVRKAGVLGGITMSLACIVSAFVPNLLLLGIFFGFLSGFAAGLSNLAAAVAVNEYFTSSDRAFAEGILTVGSGLGIFTITIFYQYLLNTYDWRGALLLVGSLVAHIIALSQLMLPMKSLCKFPIFENWRSSTNKRVRRKTNYKMEEVDDIAPRRDCTETLDENVSQKASATSCSIDAYEENKKKEKETEGETESSLNLKQWSSLSFVRKNLELFKDSNYLLLLMVDFLTWFCQGIPLVHLPERIRLAGIDVDTAAWITSFIGLFAIAGRMAATGFVSIFDLNTFHALGLVNISIGIASIISPFFSTKEGFIAYSIWFGLMSANFPLMKASAVYILGVERFPVAYSWMLMVEGVGIVCGIPFAGWINDVTHSYDYLFYLIGLIYILSGILVFLRTLIICLQTRVKRKDIILLMPCNK